MKYLLWIILAAGIFSTDINKTARINSIKKEAKEAFLNNDFDKAIQKYSLLVDSLKVKEDEVTLNLAHAYFAKQDTALALNHYSRLKNSPDKRIQSKSFQQMGVIQKQKNDLQAALKSFKNALKANPANEDARYNYEVVKKMLENQRQQNQEQQDQEEQKNEEQQQDQEQQQQDQEQQQQDQEQQQEQEQKEQQQQDQEQQQDQQGQDQNQEQQKEQEQQQQQGEESEQEEKEGEPQPQQQEQEGEEQEKQEKPLPSPAEQLEEMNISEEKAKVILEAMKNNEIQYIQQNRRKPKKKPDSGKPDW
jgi:Ca-activated chloride channel family protein